MALQTITFPVLPIVRTHLIVNCAIVFIAILTVGLRLVSRFVAGAKLWWDDYLILFALPQGIGMLVIQGLYTPMGVGAPITETLPNLVVVLKLMVSYAIIYTTCISTVKLSVLCFYLRVFVDDGMRRATKIVLVFVSAWTLANILLLFLLCRPFAANYDPSVHGTCGDRPKAFVSIGAFNIISDFLVLTLPIPTIWTLNTKTPMKLALTFVFLIGLLVSAVAVCRIIALQHLQLTNITGTMVWVDFLSTLEVNLGILCVSLPALGPLVSRYRNTRGASKLEHYDPYPSGRSGRSGQSGSGSKKSQKDDTIVMESLYGHNMEATHIAMVTSAKDRAEVSSQDGSEVNLSPVRKGSSIDQPGPGIVLVQTQWTIHRS